LESPPAADLLLARNTYAAFMTLPGISGPQSMRIGTDIAPQYTQL
jgi:hypothetical protein